MRSPHLYDTMRRFCLGAFATFDQDLTTGADLPFAFEEHGTYGRPTLYEYRPLVRGFVEARTDRLFARDDVREAVADLQREPAARIFARAHDGGSDEARALFRSVLVPLLVRTAEGCGGFDWDDGAFDRSYEELESSLFGEGHSYGAVAPLIGISCGATIELGDGIRVRAAAAGELAAMWPEANGLLPRDFGREVDRLCVLELERPLEKGAQEVPDAPGELADAVTAPPGEPTRLDPFRASVAEKLRPQLALADDDASLGDALDRWELSLFQDDPFRGQQLKHALDAALGDGEGLWAAGMRAGALLGETAEERADLVERFRAPTSDLVRRLLVAVLLHGARGALLRELDGALLGLRAGRERVAQLRAS
jgi:hypothetical protein